jgi:hypothetical protein
VNQRAALCIATVLSVAALAITGITTSASAGFRTPESVIRNIYAYYGDSSPGYRGGLPRDDETARMFFDPGLQQPWTSARPPPYDFFVQSPTWKLGDISIAVSRKQFDRIYMAVHFTNNSKPVSLSFIVVKGTDGWVVYDVETPHDSLRLFLAQLKN